MQRDCFQIQAAVQVHRRDDVLQGRNDALDRSDMLLLESERGRGSRNSSRCRRTSRGLGVDRGGLRLRWPREWLWLRGRGDKSGSWCSYRARKCKAGRILEVRIGCIGQSKAGLLLRLRVWLGLRLRVLLCNRGNMSGTSKGDLACGKKRHRQPM